MGNKIKNFFIGRPLRNEALAGEKMGVLWGLPILASDAISSVAYAGQLILLVLIPAIGFGAYAQLGYITAATIGLMAILVLSYRQTIDNYPNGGGAFVVAKENLGVIPGVVAGASLTVGYILTVAVSVASGVEQLASTFPGLKATASVFGVQYPVYTVMLSAGLVVLLMIGNLRGIRESARIFGVPTYLFIAGMLAMLGFGAFHILSGKAAAGLPEIKPTAQNLTMPLLILTLQAFSNGCSALTGVEAVSNSVPSFRSPSNKYAKTVLLLLSVVAAALLSGTAFLAFGYRATVGGESSALIVQLAGNVFGKGFMYYYIMGSTFLILILAANTAYTGFPVLVSVMAREGYAPRQLSMRGDRLSFSNGIMLLSAAAIMLLVFFRAKVEGLIGLYAVGVFISFTLSQTGMLRRWLRKKGKSWPLKAAVNGLGALVTAAVVAIVSIFKFAEGAWIVVFLIPVLIFMMLRTKRHYTAVAKQLRVSDESIAELDISRQQYRNRVIVPMDSINQTSVRALRFAKTISDNVTAFSVATDEEAEAKLRRRWSLMHTDIPYVIKYSPYRKVVEPLLEFIKSAEYDYRKGDMITVMLPQFAVRKLWNRLLHNRTRVYIERQLLKHKHIVVAVMPFQLKDDKTAIGEDEYMD